MHVEPVAYLVYCVLKERGGGRSEFGGASAPGDGGEVFAVDERQRKLDVLQLACVGFG